MWIFILAEEKLAGYLLNSGKLVRCLSERSWHPCMELTKSKDNGTEKCYIGLF